MFTVALFPVQLWAAIVLFQEIPVLLLRLPMGEILGVVAYVEAFTLVEAGVIWLGLLFWALVLPGWFLRDQFVAQGTVMVLVSSVWAVLLQLNLSRFWQLNSRRQIAWVMGYLISVALFSYYVRQSQWFAGLMVGFVKRIEPLAILYLLAAILGLVGVIIRNLG